MWKSIYKFCDNIHEFSWTVSVIKIKKEALKKKISFFASKKSQKSNYKAFKK